MKAVTDNIPKAVAMIAFSNNNRNRNKEMIFL